MVRSFRVALLLPAALCACSLHSSSREYASIAEGLTGGSGSGGITASVRMFLAPDDFCSSAPEASSLRSARLAGAAANRPMPLSALQVTALDPSGAVVANVPIAIEFDRSAIEALDRLHLQETGELLFRYPVRAGLRFRTLCQSPEVATVARLRVKR